jgi:hypothetical protein
MARSGARRGSGGGGARRGTGAPGRGREEAHWQGAGLGVGTWISSNRWRARAGGRTWKVRWCEECRCRWPERRTRAAASVVEVSAAASI